MSAMGKTGHTTVVLYLTSLLLFTAAAAPAHQAFGFDIRPQQPADVFALDKPIDKATNWRDNASSGSAALPLQVGCAFHSYFLHAHPRQASNAFAHHSSIIGKTPMFSLRRASILGGR